MRIVPISDTHTYHRRIAVPEGDVLVCCGDITFRGELDVIKDFAQWMGEQPHAHKLCVFGNHELATEKGAAKRSRALAHLRRAGIHHLENSSIKIDGVKFWGSPYTPEFYQWAYQMKRGAQLADNWSQIPDDTNVLVLHSPAYGLLDRAPRGMGQFEHVGCEELRRVIDSGRLTQLRALLCGHIHFDSGTLDHNGIQIVNAAICTESYQPTNPVRVIDI